MEMVCKSSWSGFLGKTPIEVMHHIKQGDLVDALQIPLSSDEIKKQARQLLQNARKSLRKEFLVTLKQLPDAMDKAVYVMEKYPLIVDPSGHATRYLKYQTGSFLMAGNPSDMDLKCLRRNLVGKTISFFPLSRTPLFTPTPSANVLMICVL
jgi:hypothetical protein